MLFTGLLHERKDRKGVRDMNERILFCNVAYMRYYDSTLREEVPQNGGSYVVENKTGLEINNFHSCEGKYYGFVEPGFRSGLQKEIRIENIDPAYQGKEEIPDVAVVFCAKSPTGPVIVGWYRHATVFRQMQSSAGDALYNLLAEEGNAVLIDEVDRKMKAPRANADGYGFGQSNLWYAGEDSDRVREYVDSVWEYIRNFRSEDNLLYGTDERTDEETADALQSDTFSESGERKNIARNLPERNTKARNACLKRRGHRCLICGFDAGEVYGEAFAGKIHVHHIVPIATKNEEYQIDPETDLMPVCPNCHMMLHTKVNGDYLSPEELKKVIRKHYKEGK